MLNKNTAREIAIQYTNKVRTLYEPLRVVLFGSYINGTPHEYSDIDIAIVFDGYNGDWLKAWTDLFHIREDIKIPLTKGELK
ncbi:MAG: nucleotidyltransferase domain-containing protein [Defluviitaleaceae bacterium]|nr:nucleotidyltransferase domain-containing protein [Defluviitaleaceae bacterium]